MTIQNVGAGDIDAFDAWEITMRDAVAARDRGEPMTPEECTVWRDAVDALVTEALEECGDDTDRALDALAARALAAESRLARIIAV